MSTHPIKKIAPEDRAYVEQLRRLCMALPEVTEKLAWGSPTWRVGGRLFAQLADHHHGDSHLAVWLAAPDGAQQALIESEPERFFRPAYVGHLGWVAAILGEDSDWGMVAMVVEQAHRVSAQKLPQRRWREIEARLEGEGESARPAAAAAPKKAKAPAKAKAPVKTKAKVAKAATSAARTKATAKVAKPASALRTKATAKAAPANAKAAKPASASRTKAPAKAASPKSRTSKPAARTKR